jgi:phosphoglycolate phosphatase-like HAD superfamily hydrolase
MPPVGHDACMSRPIAIVDIDGVLADVRHRLHHIAGRRKDWDGFFAAAVADPPHDEGLAIVAELSEAHEVVLLTGRPERCRTDTQRWLDDHGIGGHRLVMRPEGDRGPAARVKVELLRQLAAGREVAIVVDDDPRVVAAMTEAGYRTLRADWEQRTVQGQLTLHEAQEAEGMT